MSEYQYYEFQAIDRPLTEREMAELRAVSTRARISSTHFVNEYSWGSFKGDEDAWMDRYFDGFLYLANWGTHVLKLRLPSHLLDLATAQTYCGEDGLSVRRNGDKLILTFATETEDGENWIEGEGRISALMPIRGELARGDLRALYLGWLLCVQNENLDENAREPPVPPGLGQMSTALEALVEFLSLDTDLIAVASQASAPALEATADREEVRSWIAGLPSGEKDALLVRLVVDDDRSLAAELLQRLRRDRTSAGTEPTTPPRRRTVAELLQATAASAEQRRQTAATKRAAQQAQREQEAAAARIAHLDRITGSEPALWTQVDNLIAIRQPNSYDEAVALLTDLRDLARRDGREAAFETRLAALRGAHGRKVTFIERLKKAGL